MIIKEKQITKKPSKLKYTLVYSTKKNDILFRK